MTSLRAVSGNNPLEAVAARVLAELDPLVARMGEAYRREIPEYAVLSDAQMVADVLPTSRRLVEIFLSWVVADRELTSQELAHFENSGRERLAMGLPLESVLHAYRVAGREAWTAVCAAVQPGEEMLLGRLGARWIDIVDRTSSALARAYLAASHERLRDLDARRRELVEALLTASGVSDVAAVSLRFSTVLAPAYVPVLVAGAGAVADIDALLHAAPPGALGGHRGDRVLLLVPNRLERPPDRSGALVAWGLPALCGPALLDEVTHVEKLLGTALAEGHVTGCFGPDDLLVEQLLLGNERVAGSLRGRVADVLAARDTSGVLAQTLRVYLATGSVPETARREIVHANTVSYRLGRVRDLTGLDARLPHDATLLVLGLGLPAERPWEA
jgi:hypothetical protein